MATRAPARRRQRNAGTTTREAIVRAAARLMHRHGYQATSLDDVLRESGVGKGNFYYYFRSKEDLGFAIVDQLVASFIDQTLAPCFADADGRPLDQIRCFLDRLLDMQRDLGCVGGCPLGNLAAELSDVHEGFRERIAQVFAVWQARLTDVLEEARRRGDVKPALPAAAVARFVVAALEGAILMAKLTKDIGTMEQCVAELRRYLAGWEVAR